MKIKLLLVNVALVLFLIGLFMAVGENIKTGAILVLVGSAILTGNYLFQLIRSFKQSGLWKWQSLGLSGVLLVMAIIFVHGFSSSIDMMLVYKIKGFTTLYFIAGFLIPILFLYFNFSNRREDRARRWITIGTSAGSTLSLAGLLGFAGIAPFPVKLIFYSWVFLLFFYLIVLVTLILSKEQEARHESLRLLVITLLFAGFSIIRFNVPDIMADGLAKAIFHFGFVPFLILPAAILSIRKLYPFLVFVFYFILLDLYFIQYDANFSYLVQVGVNGCEGYYQETSFPVNTDPGISLTELLKEPSDEELDEVISEWKNKDFSPKNVEVVYAKELPNGDSIKVISHFVNGSKHYGAIRIPDNLEIQAAPILMELEGGGTGVDVSKISTLTGRKCGRQRNSFISILPSYRGCILRGEGFCFRSEGYYGDPWAGPAEDAVSFLEAVKKVYNKSDDTRILVSGVSRGATVALIIGGLTDKADYIIATSTHTKFLDEYVIKNEKVGNSYSRAFYTPAVSAKQIRKRIIASSPYYFSERLPPFEIHQGTDDDQTTIWHARTLENRLLEIGRDSNSYNIYSYEGKGHGYDDDRIVCNAIDEFIKTSRD